MMEVRFATVAAPGRTNEDYALAVRNLVAVFDGVTQPDGMDTGCVHGTAWYVRRLVAHLYAGHAANSETALPQLLTDAIDAVRGDHGGRCDLANPATPASTVCALKVDGDQAEYLVLGDSPMVIEVGAEVSAITDDRFQTTVAQIRERTLVPGGIESTGQTGRIRQFTPEKYQHINRPGGYWLAAADPSAAFEAIAGSVPLLGPTPLRRAALLTDGASCAVEDYHLYNWSTMLDLVTGPGPAELLRQVRAAERADPAGAAHLRYKRHDDATVAACLFSEEHG
jgi:hypothetical protein